jgi:hypothetical protein
MSKATLSLETINKVMQVLGTLPYQDVAEVIDMIRKDVQVVEDDGSPQEPTDE